MNKMKLLTVFVTFCVSAIVAYPLEKESEVSVTLQPSSTLSSSSSSTTPSSTTPSSTSPPTFLEKDKESSSSSSSSISPAPEETTEAVYITKHFYVHSAPEELDFSLPVTRKPNIRVYFITLPPSHLHEINNLKESNEDDTAVFVLNKNKPPKVQITSTTTERSNDEWKNEIGRGENENLSERGENESETTVKTETAKNSK